MTNFKGCKDVFDFLEMPNNPQKHQTDTTGWNMIEAMHELMFQAICLAM